MTTHGLFLPEAVREACKADDWSDVPIYVADLKDLAPRRWVDKTCATKRKTK